MEINIGSRKGVPWVRVRAFKRFYRDEQGQGLLEYGLIILLIALVCLASLNFFGQKTNNSLSNSANTVGSALT